MKKLILALALVLALALTCMTGCTLPLGDTAGGEGNDEALKADAAAIFTLDVNPGVRIYVGEDDKVIALEATNEDGEAIVTEIELEDVSYEELVELIVDKLEEKGYLEGDESSVLISVEKKAMEISDKVNAKINEAFEKHGKRASVIEQELDELDEKIAKELGDMAEKYNISEGKARLIEKIREEFPELSEEELAGLRVNDLGVMLEETSDDVKGHFKKIGKAIEDAYLGRETALVEAIESLEGLEITEEDVELPRVHFTRRDGKMLYEVSFVFDGMEYDVVIDAESGEVLSSESFEFEEFDAKGFIDDFCQENGIDPDKFKDKIKDEIKEDIKDAIGGILGGEIGNDEEEEDGEDKILTRGELLESVLAELEIADEELERVRVDLHESESGVVFTVRIKTESGKNYELVVEAYTGVILENTDEAEAA
ncbi:MAG: PepSY domain-containing protein [Clostridia bacterium]|nr:PepSY domain-containing protein [Clostridia bacterium]